MSVLPQDETGKAEHGYDYDFEMSKTAIYVDDGAGGVILWDGTADFSGDVEVNTDALEALIGEVQVSPTQYSLLERVKVLATSLTSLMALVGEVQASPTQYSLLERLKVLDTELKLKADLTETQPVSAASLPLPASAATEQTVLDNLEHYKFYAWEVDTSIYYVGYQDKEGAWYAKKIDPATGTCLYAVGGSSPPAAADLSAQSFGAFAAKF